MNYFSAAVSLLQRKQHLVSVAALVLTLTGVAAQSRARLASGQGQDRAGAQLQAAVSANSEAELQRVENSFPGTDEAALARFMRGYMRFQAKDYSTAANLLTDQNIARLTALGDYALYYRGQALHESGGAVEAEREFRRLAQNYPSSLLARTAALQSAGSAMLRQAYPTVIDDLGPLVEKNDGTALKLRADALVSAGRTNEAILTLRKLYFDAPQSAEAEKAGARLASLGSSASPADATQQKRRADRL